MAGVVLFVVAIVLSRRSFAAPTANTTAKQCLDLDVPVSISATNAKLDTPRVDSNIDAVDWVWDSYTWSHNASERMVGTIAINTTYHISAQLCVPTQGSAKSDILQIASPGLGWDKRYWDVQAEGYNYVDAAISEGYSTLIYDRIGTGDSSRPDAYADVQAASQVEVLKALTDLARSGELTKSSEIKSETKSSKLCSYKPNKIVHVGHSFGSIVTAGLLAAHGEVSDGAIVTGFVYGREMFFTTPVAYGLEYAAENDPVRFGDRGSGYVVQGTRSSIQQIFFKKGSFEPAMLVYAEEAKQPGSVGELLTGGQVLGKPAQKFKGPLQFFLGEYDDAMCGGDCNDQIDPPEVLESLYPHATNISIYLQPATGHGLTLSTNATAGYKVMFSFLKAYGL